MIRAKFALMVASIAFCLPQHGWADFQNGESVVVADTEVVVEESRELAGPIQQLQDRQGRGQRGPGGPGMGPGRGGPRGPGGPGMGPGPRGPRGPGMGPGPRGPRGPGMGPGPRGPGGPGMGPGPRGPRGPGMGPGPRGPRGPGMGPGPRGPRGPGMGPGPRGPGGPGMGPGPRGPHGRHGWGPGPGPEHRPGWWHHRGPGWWGPSGPYNPYWHYWYGRRYRTRSGIIWTIDLSQPSQYWVVDSSSADIEIVRIDLIDEDDHFYGVDYYARNRSNNPVNVGIELLEARNVQDGLADSQVFVNSFDESYLGYVIQEDPDQPFHWTYKWRAYPASRVYYVDQPGYYEPGVQVYWDW